VTTKPIPVYWDSCVYIDCIQQEPSRYPELSVILNEAQSGKVILVASALVIAEVVKLKCSSEPLPDQVKRIHEFLENDFIEVKSVDRGIAESAAELCREHSGLKPHDAIHLATAIRWKCQCLQTYDGEKRSPKKTGKYMLDFDGKIGWPALSIHIPKRLLQTQRPLLDTITPDNPENSIPPA
jgi:predicted nucleic acid-binding protein